MDDAKVVSAVKEGGKLLVDEHEWNAVPLAERRPRSSVILIWLGFPMVISAASLGATLTLSMGFKAAAAGILLGNLFLLFYVGFLSRLGQKSGFNFALLSRTTFGSRGVAIVSGFLATCVIGWFTVQSALVAVNVNAAFGWNLALWAAITGLLFMGVALVGIRGLTWIGAASAPLFVIFGGYAVIDSLMQADSLSAVWNYSRDPTVATTAMGLAVTLVAAFFIDSGTLTADFTRWAKTPLDGWLASGAGFPIGCGFAMLVGATVAAAAPTQPDLFPWLAGKGGWVAVVVTIFMFINLGSVCSHCLYNAATGWAALLHVKYRYFALAFGIVGTGIAMTNAWSHFLTWLIFLGIIVPPIGAVILADHMLPWSRHKGHDPFDIERVAGLRLAPFIAWACGSAVALWVNYNAPEWSTVITGFVVSFVAYAIIGKYDALDVLSKAKTTSSVEASGSSS